MEAERLLFWLLLLRSPLYSKMHVKPPVYQVTLEQISEKINHFVKENRQLAENIASMEQKINDSKKRLQETRRQNKMYSHEALKFKILEKESFAENMKDAILANTSGISEFESAFNEACVNEACVNELDVKPEEPREQNVQLNTEKNQLQHANAEFEDSELRALRNKKCQRVEGEKNLKDIYDALRSVKAEKVMELKLLKRKEAFLVEFFEQRKMAAEEKLKKKQCECMDMENQLSAAEENLKLVSAEAHNYKQQIEQMQEELQQKDLIFKHQISLLEKKTQDNWIKGQILERQMAEQNREAAYLRHKLAIIENQGLQEKYGMPKPVLGRSETQKPPGKDTGPGMAPMRNSNSFPTKDVQKGQVIMDARGLFPFPGPPCMPYPMGCPLLPLQDCGPFPPPPPWLPLGPYPMPPHLSDGVPV